MSAQRLPYLITKGYANPIDLWLRTDPVGAAFAVNRAVLDLGDYQMDSDNSDNIQLLERLNENEEFIHLVRIMPGLETHIPAGDYQCKLIVYNDTEWKDGLVWDTVEIGII